MATDIDWQTADIQDVVGNVMDGKFLLGGKRDDRLPIDPLVRAYRDLAHSPSIQASIGKAVSTYIESGSVEQKGFALSFYESCPTAAGGEVMAKVAKAGADGFAETTRNSTPGLIGDTMREALLYRAMSWNGGEAVDEALLKVVHEDVLSHDGGTLLHDTARHSPDWFKSHESTILSLYPGHVAAVWKARVRRGDDPEQALDDVLVSASAEGKKGLAGAIKFARNLDAGIQKTLAAKLR